MRIGLARYSAVLVVRVCGRSAGWPPRGESSYLLLVDEVNANPATKKPVANRVSKARGLLWGRHFHDSERLVPTRHKGVEVHRDLRYGAVLTALTANVLG